MSDFLELPHRSAVRPTDYLDARALEPKGVDAARRLSDLGCVTYSGRVRRTHRAV